jgi:hypothetical protein
MRKCVAHAVDISLQFLMGSALYDGYYWCSAHHKIAAAD